MTLEQCREWRDAALADGWTVEPLHKAESVATAARLYREGFIAQLILRSERSATIAAWGPDGLALIIDFPYSMEALRTRLRFCNECKASDVDTVRISFAGRVCKPCQIKLKPILEKPGWCD